MMSALKTMVGVGLLLLCVPYTAVAQVVLEHDGVSISQGELEYLISQWPPQMKRAAANDRGDRLELLNWSSPLKKWPARPTRFR